MQILYGTSNQGKLFTMRRALAPLKHIEIISLNEIETELRRKKDLESGGYAGTAFTDPYRGPVLPEIEESGATPLENARIKALAYHQALKLPVFSCDSGLYFRGLPEELQPGLHVRTVCGKRLTDEEMTAYYAGLARQYGPITARYKNAVCFVLDEEHIYESMDESLWGEAFLLVETPHPSGRRIEGFPLDCLSKHIKTGEYYYDMDENRQGEEELDQGFLRFFQKALKGINYEDM